MARDDERAAGVGVRGAALERLRAQPAAQESGHERIARTEHVEHLHRKAATHDAALDGVGNGSREHDAAHRPALEHEGRRRQPPQRAQRGRRVGRAAGDVDLLLRPDDQVAVRHDGLEVLADAVGGDEPPLAPAVTGEAPQHRPVVDVQHDLRAGRTREPHRRPARVVGARRRQVRARDEQRAGRGDERCVEVLLSDCHVGAVFAIEDQREGVPVADAEEDERREPTRIGDDVADVDARGGQGLANEAAVVLVADPCEHRRLEPEPRATHRGVRGRAAEVLGERLHVLEPPADLLTIEVHRGAADANHVEGAAGAHAAAFAPPLRSAR